MALGANRSIAQLSRIMAAGMAVGLLAVLVIGLGVNLEIHDVTERWQNYDVEAITKLDALADLRIQMGVGSVIDNVRQYQGTPDAAHRAQLDESIRLARANLDAYRAVGTPTPQEEQALLQVSAALDSLTPAGPSLPGAALPTPVDPSPERLHDAAQSLVGLDSLISDSSNRLSHENIAALDQLRLLALIGGGLALLLLVSVTQAVLVLSRRRIVLPLARLVGDSRRLAALQLDQPFDYETQDEMGELGSTLDGARRNLRDLLSENEEKTRRLAYQATHDSLTGLANRAKLIEWLNDRLKGGQRSSLALLFLDLDGFKMVNDTLGHSIGDKLLIAVANRLVAVTGPAARVVRLGGDEFVVIVELAHGDSVKETAALIGKAFSTPFPIEGMELGASTSIGIAIDDGHATSAEDLLRDADIALYRAKEAGRGRTEIFDVALREAVLVRHRLHNDLENAIAKGEIFAVYQPIMCMQREGSVSGFEALIRWNHPELGLISPAQFIPIAEETGGIIALGRFMLQSAARDLAILQENYPTPLTVNVNFSPRQMWDETHVAEILDRLRHPDCAHIKIEVTESLAMTNPDSAREILQRFSAIGIPLCIDDFGTGYSSLSYLGRFPFNVLKLDKSFIEGLSDGTPEQTRLVRGVINLAHDLGLEVVAEGIELEEERGVLAAMGCDYGQGYLFAKPLLLGDAITFLRK